MTGHARGYSRPPFLPGNRAAVTHGATSPRVLSPIVAKLKAELAEVAPWTTTPAFRPTVEAWAWAEARAARYRAWFDEYDQLGDDGEPAGLATWDRVEARAARLRAELGLSPAAYARIGADVALAGDRADGMAALRAEGAAIRQAIAAGNQGGDDEHPSEDP